MVEGVGDEGRWWSAAEPGFWQQVVEQLGTALIVTDPAGRILAANLAAERLLGRSAAAMLGEDAHDLLHRDAHGGRIPRKQCPLLRAAAERAEARQEGHICLRGDGRLIAISWSASPLRDDGAFMGMAVLLTEAVGDRSARRERAAYTRALEDLTERLTLVAEITDVLGQTLETDEALARLGRLLVPRLADWAAVDLRVGSGQVHRVAVTGPEGRDAAQEDWRERLPEAGEEASSPLVQVLNGGDPVLQREADVAAPASSALAAVHSGFLRAARATSAVTVPLGSGRQVTGALTLLRTDPSHPFDATT
ncbi:PAS domain-containing protein [Streptomyces sp. NPDC006235]|uniref:PAS domain-containing protein n=1 Tax=Streptomyces sp. NPDC006235 TaxID=3156736 RepID=UPI0033A6C18D